MRNCHCCLGDRKGCVLIKSLPQQKFFIVIHINTGKIFKLPGGAKKTSRTFACVIRPGGQSTLPYLRGGQALTPAQH